MNRKCPNCDNEGAYLYDNCTDPLDCRYYCDKCGTIFSESGKIISEPTNEGRKPVKPMEKTYYCPICGRELIESAKPNELECENCGIDFVARGGKLEEVNDQTAKADEGKPKLTLVPRQIIYDIAEVREYGNNKYPEGGPDNWKKVDKQRYRDALFRHLLLYLDDPQGVDEESGIKHLKHIACNVAFLCELEARPEDDEYVTFSEVFKMKYPETWEGTLKFIGKAEEDE